MPMYHWHCKDCDLHVEVIRSFVEYEQQPQSDELPKARGKSKKAKCKHANWQRLIGQDIRAFRGANWRGSKGNW